MKTLIIYDKRGNIRAWGELDRRQCSGTDEARTPYIDAVGPMGLEPMTRGLKVRCSAN